MASSPVVYLAGAIDQGEASDTRRRVKEALLAHGNAIFDPSGGWSVPTYGKPSGSLQAANTALLSRCDGLLAILTPDIMTVGTVLEIHYAVDNGIPVTVYGPSLKPSWALAFLGITPHAYLNDAINDLKGQMDV
jgi:nucleoside 2-deoxyribosyltransferase